MAIQVARNRRKYTNLIVPKAGYRQKTPNLPNLHRIPYIFSDCFGHKKEHVKEVKKSVIFGHLPGKPFKNTVKLRDHRKVQILILPVFRPILAGINKLHRIPYIFVGLYKESKGDPKNRCFYGMPL